MRWTIDFINFKVLILLIILLLFLIVALIIVAMEFRIKKMQKKRFTKRVENTRLMSLTRSLKKAKSPKQKLQVIDKHAKSLFRERHNVSKNRSYDELVKVFDQKKAYKYSSFCKSMFETYYAHEKVEETEIKKLIKDLTRLIRETEVYLDPQKYDVDKLYDGKNTIPKEKNLLHDLTKKISLKDVFKGENLEKKKELIEQKNESLKTKQELIEEKEKTIKVKERELDKKEKANKKMLEELEKRIKQQEEKIKQQETLQGKLEERLKKEEYQEQELKLKQDTQKELTKKIETHEIKKHWREKIDAKPITGKDWLKSRRKGRK